MTDSFHISSSLEAEIDKNDGTHRNDCNSNGRIVRVDMDKLESYLESIQNRLEQHDAAIKTPFWMELLQEETEKLSEVSRKIEHCQVDINSVRDTILGPEDQYGYRAPTNKKKLDPFQYLQSEVESIRLITRRIELHQASEINLFQQVKELQRNHRELYVFFKNFNKEIMMKELRAEFNGQIATVKQTLNELSEKTNHNYSKITSKFGHLEKDILQNVEEMVRHMQNDSDDSEEEDEYSTSIRQSTSLVATASVSSGDGGPATSAAAAAASDAERMRFNNENNGDHENEDKIKTNSTRRLSSAVETTQPVFRSISKPRLSQTNNNNNNSSKNINGSLLINSGGSSSSSISISNNSLPQRPSSAAPSRQNSQKGLHTGSIVEEDEEEGKDEEKLLRGGGGGGGGGMGGGKDSFNEEKNTNSAGGAGGFTPSSRPVVSRATMYGANSSSTKQPLFHKFQQQQQQQQQGEETKSDRITALRKGSAPPTAMYSPSGGFDSPPVMSRAASRSGSVMFRGKSARKMTKIAKHFVTFEEFQEYQLAIEAKFEEKLEQSRSRMQQFVMRKVRKHFEKAAAFDNDIFLRKGFEAFRLNSQEWFNAHKLILFNKCANFCGRMLVASTRRKEHLYFQKWRHTCMMMAEATRLRLWLKNVVIKWLRISQPDIKEYLKRWKTFTAESFRAQSSLGDGLGGGDGFSAISGDNFNIKDLKELAHRDLRHKMALRIKQEAEEARLQAKITAATEAMRDQIEGNMKGMVATVTESVGKVGNVVDEFGAIRSEMMGLRTFVDDAQNATRVKIEMETKKSIGNINAYKSLMALKLAQQTENLKEAIAEQNSIHEQASERSRAIEDRITLAESDCRNIEAKLGPIRVDQANLELTVGVLSKAQRDTDVRLHGMSEELLHASRGSVSAVETMKRLESSTADHSTFYDTEIRTMKYTTNALQTRLAEMARSRYTFEMDTKETLKKLQDTQDVMMPPEPMPMELLQMCLEHEEILFLSHSKGHQAKQPTILIKNKGNNTLTTGNTSSCANANAPAPVTATTTAVSMPAKSTAFTDEDEGHEDPATPAAVPLTPTLTLSQRREKLFERLAEFGSRLAGHIATEADKRALRALVAPLPAAGDIKPHWASPPPVAAGTAAVAPSSGSGKGSIGIATTPIAKAALSNNNNSNATPQTPLLLRPGSAPYSPAANPSHHQLPRSTTPAANQQTLLYLSRSQVEKERAALYEQFMNEFLSLQQSTVDPNPGVIKVTARATLQQKLRAVVEAALSKFAVMDVVNPGTAPQSFFNKYGGAGPSAGADPSGGAGGGNNTLSFQQSPSKALGSRILEDPTALQMGVLYTGLPKALQQQQQLQLQHMHTQQLRNSTSVNGLMMMMSSSMGGAWQQQQQQQEWGRSGSPQRAATGTGVMRPATATARLGAGAGTGSGNGTGGVDDVNYDAHHHDNCFYNNINNNATFSNTEENLPLRAAIQQQQQYQELKEDDDNDDNSNKESDLVSALEREYQQRLQQQSQQDGDLDSSSPSRPHRRMDVQIPSAQGSRTGSRAVSPEARYHHNSNNSNNSNGQQKQLSQREQYVRTLPTLSGFDDSLHLSTSIVAGTPGVLDYSQTGGVEDDSLLRQQYAQLQAEGEIDKNGELSRGLNLFGGGGGGGGGSVQQQNVTLAAASNTPAGVARLLRAAANANASTLHNPTEQNKERRAAAAAAAGGAYKGTAKHRGSTQEELANALAMQFRQDISFRPTDSELLEEQHQYIPSMSPPKPLNASQAFGASAGSHRLSETGTLNGGVDTMDRTSTGLARRGGGGRGGGAATADGSVLYQSRKLVGLSKEGQVQQMQYLSGQQ